jgi:uncharacterized damage-inducible protein DinB
MSPIERITPPLSGSETEILVGMLEWHRDTLRIKTEGLDAGQLDQRLEPSTMTLGGMLKHLAYVEDWWFNQVFAGNPAPEPWALVDWKADEDWDWHSAADDTPEQLRAILEEAIATSDRIISKALAGPEGLDAEGQITSKRHPGQQFNLRWIVVHMIEEYARHNGHADLIRESIDGQVGQ